jgi:hypothetical protein
MREKLTMRPTKATTAPSQITASVPRFGNSDAQIATAATTQARTTPLHSARCAPLAIPKREAGEHYDAEQSRKSVGGPHVSLRRR